MTQTVYVSITGLRIRRPWHLPVFWRHAMAAMAQARNADGCLDAAARNIDGIHHTRTVWRDRQAMQAYLSTGAHLKAMKIFNRVATGKTFGFETESVPDWNDVHRLWHDRGRHVT